MATLNCRLGTGVSSYVVHVAFSETPDPYPNGATITSGKALYNVKNGATVTIRASETECASGYTFPVYVYTSTDGSTWSQVDYLQSGTVTFSAGSGTLFVRVGPATKGGSSGYDTNLLHFQAGSGVKSFKVTYDGSQKTNIISDPIGSVTVGLFVRDGTNAVAHTIEPENDYAAPYLFTEYKDSTYSSVKKYFEKGDFNVLSNGVRYLRLTATYSPTYWYQMHADANGGKFSNGSTIWSSDVLSTKGNGGAVSYAVSDFPTPTRGGYTFVGWGANKTSTTTYDLSVSFTTNVTSSSNPKEVTVYAIWKKTEFTCHIKIGAGINSASVYVDDVLKSRITDKVYHDITVSYDSTITVKSIAKASGYTRPYKFNFYQNSSSTVPTSTLERDTDEPSYTYSDSRFYAEIVATKSSIDLFYWNTAGTDASLFAAGKPISNLTAARWNKLKAKIKELADAWGSTYTYTEVSTGDAITAVEFNSVRTAINNRAGHGTLPAAQSKGDAIKASLFEGSASLKSALNAAITYYNNY